VISICIAPLAESLVPQLNTEAGNTSIHKIIKAIESGLGYQFHASWGLVLQMFAVLYQVRTFQLCNFPQVELISQKLFLWLNYKVKILSMVEL
jgi:hypothetical protein